ncbi:MAG: tetratricopeptide repeat protein [Betaproteobacteria bacterium]|nr:MAG: tetratricopeptide repeat protein [Betaproteobacteria bacterium]
MKPPLVKYGSCGADKLSSVLMNLLDQTDADLREGRVSEAVLALRAHVGEHPGDAAATERLAFACHRLGDLPAAAAAFESLCSIQPSSASAASNFATVLGQMQLYDEALRHFDRAIALDAGFIDARFNRAQILEMRGRTTDAINDFRQVVEANPGHRVAWYRLGNLLIHVGQREEAQAAFDRAITLDSDYAEARWARTMSTLPQAYDIGEVPEIFYDEFSQRLASLDRWFAEGRDALGHRAVGHQQPYYIVYHDRNNREVLSRYGDLCARLMNAWYGERPPVAGSSRNEPINVAIVSGNVHDHAVWTAIVRGWCREIDRSRFRLSIVYTDKIADSETDIARASVDRFIEGQRDLGGWVDAVVDVRPDVLVYPEVGMDRTCIKLASLRLAPVQVATWGHAETTGMPAIDYFLSADAFESAAAQDNYRERLVRLPGIGTCYAALNPAKIDLDLRELDLDPDRPIALCPATPYKFLPAHDWTLAAIARDAPTSQLVFVTDNIAPRLSDLIARRLRAAFENAELDYDRHVRFIDQQSRPRYFALMRQSSIYLDTIAFSGFNTAMQAFECGLPVLTVEGRFLRNRFASGLLREMGVDELIATSAKAYVDNAVRLLTSPALLSQTRSKIIERFPALLDRSDSVRAFEAFLESVAPARIKATTKSWLDRVRGR